VNAPRRAGAAALLAATLLAVGASVSAQGIRAAAVTSARYVSIRPLVRDSVPRDLVTVLPDGTFEFEGRPVFCAGTLPCVFYRSLDIEHAFALVQDVDFTAWGLGVPGLSVTAALRGRARLNGDFIWPQSEDAFDAILAYAEYDRDPFRFRLGRQRTLGGLGFYGYDGASVLYEPTRRIALEAYGGRSLARGLYEPRKDALRGFEDFLPDRDAYLIGAWGEVEPTAGTAIAARYQREIWSDRSALLSERASLDIRTDLLEPVSLLAAADYDFAFGRVGKANLTARLPYSRFTFEATARRYVPYFELWTIWGFFSPVAYNELETLASWRARPRLTAWASAGWRRYADAQAPVVLSQLEDESVRIGVGATYVAPNDLTLIGETAMERGFGAFLISGDLSVRWQPHPRAAAMVGGTAFQQIEQFRVGEGVVFGGNASLDVDLTARVGVGAGLSLYRQTYENRPSSANWNQRRGWASVRVLIGDDPGIVAGTRP
jgi:hypothetical protein